MRLNEQWVEHSHVGEREGDFIIFACDYRVQVVRVTHLLMAAGAEAEAQLYYEEMLLGPGMDTGIIPHIDDFSHRA